MKGIIALRQGAEYVAQVETLSCLRGAEAEVVREDATQSFRAARESFEAAVGIRPDFSEAWNNLAVAALNLQDWDAAITAANKALENGTYGEPHVARGNLGWAHYQKKDLLKAWRELHDAVSRQPGFCVGRYRLAKVYVDRGELAEADEQLSAVIADKRCPVQEAYLLAGLVAHKMGDEPRADELLRRCEGLAPKSCTAGECRRYGEMVSALPGNTSASSKPASLLTGPSKAAGDPSGAAAP